MIQSIGRAFVRENILQEQWSNSKTKSREISYKPHLRLNEKAIWKSVVLVALDDVC